jgi:uncharacterized FlaG/YvyC family protein
MDGLSLNVNAINIANNNNNASDANNINASIVNSKNNAVQQNAGNNNKNTPVNQTNSVNNNAEKEKELSKQIDSNLNPSPMLSQAMLFKWDASAGGAVINVVDFKTGKVLAQIPPNSVLKMMSNYQKGSLFNSKL